MVRFPIAPFATRTIGPEILEFSWAHVPPEPLGKPASALAIWGRTPLGMAAPPAIKAELARWRNRAVTREAKAGRDIRACRSLRVAVS